MSAHLIRLPFLSNRDPHFRSRRTCAASSRRVAVVPSTSSCRATPRLFIRTCTPTRFELFPPLPPFPERRGGRNTLHAKPSRHRAVHRHSLPLTSSLPALSSHAFSLSLLAAILSCSFSSSTFAASNAIPHIAQRLVVTPPNRRDLRLRRLGSRGNDTRQALPDGGHRGDGACGNGLRCLTMLSHSIHTHGGSRMAT